jgi:hypothetical protein
MKQSLLKNTSAYQFGVRPAVLLRDMSEVPLPQVIKSVNTFFDCGNVFKICQDESGPGLDENPSGKPERDALIFYMMNHVVSMIRQGLHPYEPIHPDKLALVDEYHRQLAYRSTRMFFYMLLICTREARHEKGSSKVSNLPYNKIILNHHAENMGESAVLNKIRKDPPKVSIGEFTRFLSDQFYKGSYSHGFGGPAWGKVADVLRDFVHGKLSAEMMLDTAFTLCHNNGPIFNKGMLFEHYTEEIKMILDVQRSGQIPQMVGNKETKFASDPLVKALFLQSNEVLEGKLSGHVDWFAVEALGALQKYPDQKKQQMAKYGKTNTAYPDQADEELPDTDEYGLPVHKTKAPKVKAKLDPLKPFEIMPGVTVPKCQSRPSV